MYNPYLFYNRKQPQHFCRSILEGSGVKCCPLFIFPLILQWQRCYLKQYDRFSHRGTLNTNINTTCKVLVPCFMSWNKRSLKFSICTNPVSQHFSFAKIIYPPDRCCISTKRLNSMIITQVHLVLGTKYHSKMSFVTTQYHRCLKFWGSLQLACWLQECPPVLLPENWMLISLP